MLKHDKTQYDLVHSNQTFPSDHHASHLLVTEHFLTWFCDCDTSLPVGLAGGVEHSRLKSVGEWLLLNRGLKPATARAWERTKEKKNTSYLQYFHSCSVWLFFYIWDFKKIMGIARVSQKDMCPKNSFGAKWMYNKVKVTKWQHCSLFI